MEQIHALNPNEIRAIVIQFMNRKLGKLPTGLTDLDTAHGIITHDMYCDMDRKMKDWAWTTIQGDLEAA